MMAETYGYLTMLAITGQVLAYHHELLTYQYRKL